MKELLIPAVAFMNRLKYVQKFILISAIFLIPTGLTVYLLMADIDRQIEFTKKERLGIEYNDAVRQLLEHFQQHRGMVNANLNGESSFRESIISKQAQIEQVINQIDLIDGKSGKQLRTGQRWNSIKTGWESLREDMYQSPPIEGIHLSHTIIQENFEMHSSLIAGMLSLIVHISEASSLKLEPGYDSYLLMDTTVNKLPMVIETTGKLRGFGSGIAAKKTILPEEKLQLTIWSQMILSALQDMEGSMDTFDSPKLTALLSPLIKQFLEETRVFTEVVQRELIDVEQLHIESSKLFDIGTNAIELGYSLYDKESPYLDHILEERVDQLFKQKVFIIAFSVMVTLIIAYLFAAFYESTIRTVFALKQASMRFADGDMSARIDLRVKDELQVVGHAFNTMVDAFEQMLAERRVYEEKIEYQAYFDALTGLPNRVLFNDRLELALSDSERDRQLLAVMFLDLDRFKNINDTLGHDAGDLLLKAVSERLKACLREGDTVSRMGGDEFMVILPDIGSVVQARALGEQILEHLSAPIQVHQRELFISASIGISLYPFDGDDISHLVKNADTAMYVAKKQGRNRCQLYDPEMNAAAEGSLNLENALRKALEQDEFFLHYQPRFDMRSGTITGIEALIRWRHPELGLVSPAEFIPIAEELGMIIPIGEWVLRTACGQSKRWKEEEGISLRMSVNISASQFQHPEFVEIVSQILKETGVEPDNLEMELTESIVMKNGTLTILKLKELKELGIQISIDDFGTGFSSLSYLKYFPIDTLKIDRSFIKDIPTAHKDTAITKTIIALARRLNLKVVAEGVETEEQFAFLSTRKCDEVQGYLISKPLPPEEVIELMRG